MSTCYVCNVLLDDSKSDSFVKCVGGCGRFAHSTCAKDDKDLPVENPRKTRSAREWKCRECRNTSSSKNSAQSSASELTKECLVRILEQFKIEVFEELKTFKSDMTELSSSVQFVSDALDTSNKLMTDIREELTNLKKENKELREHSTILSTEVRDLKERLRNLEQYTRKNNVEVSGIPETAGENVLDIVSDMGAVLGVEINEHQVNAAHRVPSYKKDRTPSIVIQFNTRVTKDTLLAKFREMKTLSAHQVNPVFPQQKVYVNEHLSPENKVFLARLKQKCKEVGYTYAWCRDGKFFVRRETGENSKKISSYDDFSKIK